MLAANVCTTHAWHYPLLLHPLCGQGYQAWSGIIGDFGLFTVALSALWGAYMLYRRHNCHVHRCPRISWHPHPEHGHPVCGTHHPDHPKHHRADAPHLLHASRHRYP